MKYILALAGLFWSAFCCAIPGTYSAVVGRDSGVELYILSLQPGGVARADRWEWINGRTNHWTPSAYKVGHVCGETQYDDSAYITTSVQVSASIQFGSWSLSGTTLKIIWPYRTELWTYTAIDTALNKLELIPQAANEFGYAFGAYGWGMDRASDLPAVTPFVGMLRQWNRWVTPMTVTDYPQAIEFKIFDKTSTGTFRYAEIPTYAYVTRAKEITPRMVFMQASHDWDGNGRIDNDFGHTNTGLQIIDANGALRGFVFAESSCVGATPAVCANGSVTITTGAMYLLN